ncbi:hypothetical protein JCM19992_28170 [Thermostilla marina]
MEVQNALVKALASQLGGEVTRTQGTAAEKESQTTTASEAILEAVGTRQDELYEILQKYDITHITPREVARMLDDLHTAGIIDDAQFKQLSGILQDLQKADIEPDEAVDLLRFYQQRMKRLAMFQEMGMTDNDLPSADDMQARLEWLEKYEAARTGIPEGFDALV